MKTLRLVAIVSAAFLAASGAFAGDPSGSWEWTITTPNGESIDCSLELTLADGELTGTYSNRFGETPISDASFEDDALAFSVEREFNGNEFTIKYQGKLDGDSIKGTFEFPGFGGGDPSVVDWTATRKQ